MRDMATTATQHLPPTPPAEHDYKSASHIETTMPNQEQEQEQEPKHIWIITGPAGCGKSSVAEYLARTFDLPYLEGDAFHTPTNISKMASGHPLTDADRWDWLRLLRTTALATPGSVVLTCSALKRSYRDILRGSSTDHTTNVHTHFIFLNASEAALMERVRARKGHYMKDSMVHSQFEVLEAPVGDEGDVLSVDAAGSSVEVQRLAGEVVGGVMGRR